MRLVGVQIYSGCITQTVRVDGRYYVLVAIPDPTDPYAYAQGFGLDSILRGCKSDHESEAVTNNNTSFH